MRRILLPLAIGLTLLWFWPRLHDLFRTDEERIRALVRRMERGYDEGDAGDATEGFASDWVDEGSGIDVVTLRRALLHRFLQERQSRRSEPFGLRAEVPEERLSIALDPEDEDLASVRALVRLERRSRDDWRLSEELEVVAELRRGPRGWEIFRTRRLARDGRR